MATPTILINLERCTGCWTCSMACKIGNKLPDDVWWQTVRTLGSGEGIDRPGGKWPNLHMSWLPVYNEGCIMCKGRTAKGEEPFCTDCCPTQAMIYGDIDDPNSELALMIEKLRDRDFRLFRLPSWESSRDNIVYASKD